MYAHPFMLFHSILFKEVQIKPMHPDLNTSPNFHFVFPPKPSSYIPPKQNVLERLDDLKNNVILKKKSDLSLYTTINPDFISLYNPPYNLSRQSILFYSNLRATSIKMKSKSSIERQAFLTCVTLEEVGFLSGISKGATWNYKTKLEKAGLLEVYRTFGRYKIYKIYEV